MLNIMNKHIYLKTFMYLCGPKLIIGKCKLRVIDHL